MKPKPPFGVWGVALTAVALALFAACGDATRPAPRDEASLAPYVSTPELIVEEMLRLANVGKEDVINDLESGDGRIVITAAKTYGARGVGFELDASLVSLCTENARRAGVSHLVEFRQQDVLTVDLSPATVVAIYLSREANLRLRPASRASCGPVPSSSHTTLTWAIGRRRPFGHC
jgi:hypothetical protein